MASSGKVTGSQLIGRALKLEGVHNVFALAGDHTLPVMDTMFDMDFRFVDVRHEQAAVHMADAWGRITGQPGVTLFTTPGMANSIPGLANAMHGGSPVVNISGSAAASQLGRGAMQEIEQTAMAAPVTKGSWLVPDARRIPDYLARAFRTAMTGRRGPVHLTIPIDVQEQTVDESEVAFFSAEQYRAEEQASASPEAIREIVRILQQAQRPMIVAGGPAADSNAGEPLVQLLDVTGLPLLTEEHATGIVSDDHPSCFGLFVRGLNRVANLLAEADVVVFLGRKMDNAVGFGLPPSIAADAKVIQVDPDPAEVGRNRGADVGITADVGAVVKQLVEEAAKHTWSPLPWVDRLRGVQAAHAEWLDTLAKPEAPMHGMYLHKTLAPYLRPDDFLIFDGGDFCHFGRCHYKAHMAGRYLYLSTLGMLGASLPSAIAAKIAHPEARVINLCGDGGFGFQAMELDTAVRHKIPLTVIIGNDSAWGTDKQRQLGFYGRAVVTDLLQSRYDIMAQGLGCYGEFVETPEQLAPALERALSVTDRPYVVNVAVQQAISPRAQDAIDRHKAAASSEGH